MQDEGLRVNRQAPWSLRRETTQIYRKTGRTNAIYTAIYLYKAGAARPGLLGGRRSSYAEVLSAGQEIQELLDAGCF